jgi:hypothetical protein
VARIEEAEDLLVAVWALNEEHQLSPGKGIEGAWTLSIRSGTNDPENRPVVCRSMNSTILLASEDRESVPEAGAFLVTDGSAVTTKSPES